MKAKNWSCSLILASLFWPLMLAGQDTDRRFTSPIVGRKQVALVIGNSSYTRGPLKNPVNDARAMASRLEALHFDVNLLLDANRKEMAKGIDAFIGKLGSGDVALFYYSGHGMQVDGENYLVPVDFEGQSETDVRYDTFAAGRVQDKMEKSGAQLNILVLDACRNNPYRSVMRGGSDGLAAMNPARGTFIAFATAPGRTASDNAVERNGLFTGYLLEALQMPGLSLNDVFDYVRENVDTKSGGKQLPWTLSSVVGRYRFLGDSRGTAAPPPRPVPRSDEAVAGQVRVNAKDGQRYVYIPPGVFSMGCSPGDNECYEDEKPAHLVSITKGFWIGQTAVTVGAWKKYRAATGTRALGTGDTFGRKNLNEASGNDSMPAVAMTWDEAKSYCEWSGARLPTEAEWEFAARAGNANSRYGDLDAIAWYANNSGDQQVDSIEIWRKDSANYYKRLFENGDGPRPVGQKTPNAWNLYDILGNVWQWTADLYSDRYYQQKEGSDPQGPPGGKLRVLRGGYWGESPRNVRLSGRLGSEPSIQQTGVSCRCVRELP